MKTQNETAHTYTITAVDLHRYGGGWLVALDDRSLIFCPNDRCQVEPKPGERCRVQYAGATCRVTGIAIGDPPRDYGAVGRANVVDWAGKHRRLLDT